MGKFEKPTSETWGWASPRRAVPRRGEGPWKLQGLPPCSLPPTRPPQQVISVKTGRLAVLLIIHEAALPRSGRQRRRGSSSPREGESQAAWLSGRAGVGWGGPLFLLPFALSMVDTQGWCSLCAAERHFPELLPGSGKAATSRENLLA